MADTFELELATPERLLMREQVSEAQIPGSNGYLGILPGHAPLLSELAPGYMSYTSGGRKFFLAIRGGFVEVLPDKVTVLARIAEREGDIDMARAEAAMARAEQRIGEPRTDIDFERARIAMMKSLIRLQVASRARTRA